MPTTLWKAGTRAEFIDKQLEAAGWSTGGDVRVQREYNINAGEIRAGGIRTGKLIADYVHGGEEWYLEIRYANKALELAKDKTAIVIPTKDKIVSTIELAIQAVEEKELDSSIAKIAEEKKKGFSKAV
jgi:hypothetical protein